MKERPLVYRYNLFMIASLQNVLKEVSKVISVAFPWTCHRMKMKSQAVFQAKTPAKNCPIELPPWILAWYRLRSISDDEVAPPSLGVNLANAAEAACKSTI